MRPTASRETPPSRPAPRVRRRPRIEARPLEGWKAARGSEDESHEVAATRAALPTQHRRAHTPRIKAAAHPRRRHRTAGRPPRPAGRRRRVPYQVRVDPRRRRLPDQDRQRLLRQSRAGLLGNGMMLLFGANGVPEVILLDEGLHDVRTAIEVQSLRTPALKVVEASASSAEASRRDCSES